MPEAWPPIWSAGREVANWPMRFVLAGAVPKAHYHEGIEIKRSYDHRKESAIRPCSPPNLFSFELLACPLESETQDSATVEVL
jgi:hypothetical protein